ncbi:hypothetical protein IFO70_14225 [Phormidium tenue FACHB-886]|nr:hypothetical protein [Phormidium tenue FACHB-886]
MSQGNGDEAIATSTELEPDELELHARIEAAQKLLPSWFVTRMMSDSWYFGLLTVSNTIIGIQCIDDVQQAADGTIWLDVTLLDTNLLRTDVLQQDVLIAPTSRTRASINVNQIVAAFELEDT